jgi:uncharacterized phage infection (PIP) family protein YhgE
MSDQAINAARKFLQPFADIMPVLADIERAGSMATYEARLKGSIEALRRDEDAAKLRIEDARTEGQRLVKAAKDEVTVIYSSAADAKFDADKYVKTQKTAADLALKEAQNQATAIVERAKSRAEQVIADYGHQTEEAKRMAESARADLVVLQQEIAAAQSLLDDINRKLHAVAKSAA